MAKENLLKKLWYRAGPTLKDKKGDLNNSELIDAMKYCFFNESVSHESRINLYESFYSLAEGYAKKNISIQDRVSGYSEDSLNHTLYNILGSAISTQYSRIGEQKIVPFVIANGSDYSMYLRARKFDKFLQGVAYLNNQHRQGAWAFKDAATIGIGYNKVYHNGESVIVEYVNAKEVFVNEQECRYGPPKTIYQYRPVSIDELCEDFPEYEAILAVASTKKYGNNRSSSVEVTDMVYVLEGWHESNTFGRHCMIIPDINLVLVDEPWEKSIPFSSICYEERLDGFYGIGIVEQGAPLQIEIAKVMDMIRKNIEAHGNTPIYCPDYMVQEMQQRGHLGIIIPYDASQGAPGIVKDTSGSVAQQVYEYPFRLAQELLNLLGISRMSAMARREPSIESGRAMREIKASEEVRHQSLLERYSEFTLKTTQLVIETSKDLYKVNGDLKVKWKSEKTFEEIHWDDVNMEDDAYILKIIPTSGLPREMSARRQEVEEMTKAGYFTKGQAMRLIDMPDLSSTMNTEMAAENFSNWIISEALEYDRTVDAEKHHHLALNIDRCRAAMLESETRGCPAELIENLEYYIDSAISIIDTKRAEEQQMLATLSGQEAPPDQVVVPGEVNESVANSQPMPGEMPVAPGESAPPIQPITPGSPRGVNLPT